ncbi:MAG: cation-translocating P-type ATPase [Lachnospiraceae bacterium]|nr:cation-translocating P-type ATPase [Ruminococcus sp.]MCM1274997.1 cation-translocating P-type ATPase [Lachnospiraceae bacterium]
MNNDIQGLTAEEAAERAKNGQSNGSFDIKTKSVPRIFRDNIFTLFNLINVILAALVALVGSWRNMLFMGVVICNISIGILQEIRSKRVIDRLAIISAPRARVIRDGSEVELPVSDIVVDDVMLLAGGRQVCADAVVLEGECEADESLITGESDPVPKKQGGELLSGSFIVSGSCAARAVRVGAQSTSGKITSGAKYIKNHSSEMMKSINKIIRIVSVCIVPFGLILFYKAFFVTELSLEDGVTGTVAALIGMIPEGLVLLTSIALAVSTIRLGRRRTLCQDLYCVESLARADVLCLDKTGTLTEGCMELREVRTLDNDFDVDGALNAFAAAFPEPNATLGAVCERFAGGSCLAPLKTVPFSSARKWSAARFDGLGTLALGAPSFVLGDDYSQIADICEEYAAKGFRVLVLAQSPLPLGEGKLPEGLSAKALVVLSDKIRRSAPDTLEYFKRQGVALKVISGDDPVTVSSVAERAGLDGAENYIDMRDAEDEKIPEIAEKYTVFGRVTPNQKQLLVKALKAAGHKVAMTGDGVNDVPALKEADCSIAMQSGSDAARAVSQLVLLSSDFASMPLVVEEGRRCINNIQRSAALFLVKTIFSFLLAAAFLALPYGYPFKPIQMTLISALAIGAPSFLLALEPNKSLVRGSFLSNVMKKAAPGGVSVAVGICLLTAAEGVFGFSPEQTSTMAVCLTGFACFLVLGSVCRPFKPWRAAMLAALIAAFVGAALLFPTVFYIVPLNPAEWAALGVLAAAVLAVQAVVGITARRPNAKR